MVVGLFRRGTVWCMGNGELIVAQCYYYTLKKRKRIDLEKEGEREKYIL